MSEKVVLAYSGGLDTSVAIRWIKEKYGMEVITLTADVGGDRDLGATQQKALDVGAIKALVVDAKKTFIEHFVFPALQADAVYQGAYPLATALSRPLIAKLMTEAARSEGASAIAQAPHLKVVAPAREWGMTREETIAYAQKYGIPVPVTSASPYSIDENLWGRSVECGVLEDPWVEPPEDAFEWTRSPQDAPDQPHYVEIGFEKGIPTSLDGRRMDGVDLVREINGLAGKHGVGRIDHIEDRLVGIKSREVYEAPAAVVLLAAHKALEAMTLSRDQLRFKQMVAAEYADLVYNGLWFSSMHQDLAAYVQSSQRYVTGQVRLKLHKGSCTVVARRSPYSLYRHELATYEEGDLFDQSASPGFIQIWGLSVRVQAQAGGEALRAGAALSSAEEQRL